jgi:hypothetical protein
MRENLIRNNFYFCLQRDLTLSYQRALQQRPPERKYFWNESMLQMFNYYQLPPCWRVPVIQGHVGELHS